MNQSKSYARIGWVICLLGALFYCYEYFLRIMPSVMANDLMRAFHINATLLGGLAAFYYHAYTPMQIPVGILMDRYGPKRLIVLAVQICGIGMLLFGMSGHYALACLGRFLVGFGSAFAFVGVLKLASIWLPLRFFGFVAGATTALGTLGGMFGSIYLERIVRFNGWQTTITLSVMMALLLAIFIGLMMPLKNPENIQDETIIHYREVFRNLWTLVKHPVIWLNGIVGCFLYLSLSVFAELWGPKYLEAAHHLSSHDAVMATSRVYLAWVIGGPIIGMLAKNFRRSIYLLLTGAIMMGIFSTVLLTVHGLSYNTIQLVLFLFALGSASQVLVFNIACRLVDKKFAGTAVAFTNMLVMLGGNIFEPFVGKVLDVLWHGQFAEGIKTYSAATFNSALMVLPIAAFVSILILLVMRKYIPASGEDYKHQNANVSQIS